MSAKECPRCRGPREPGFVLDKRHGDMLRQRDSLEGELVRSFWHGLRTKGRERHPVRTFR